MATATSITLIRILSGALLLLYQPLGLADLHGTLTATTNNTARWFSKSNNNVALQANIDYEHDSGFYVGSTVSNVDFVTTEAADNPANVEIVPYLGWSTNLNQQWRLDLQWSRYLYDGNVFGHAADYNEIYLFLNYGDLLTTRASIAEDYYGLGDYAIDYAITGRYPITDALKLSASFGYAQTRSVLGSDYPYWNVGFAYAYQFVTFAVHYMDATETNIHQGTADKIHAFYNPPVLDAAFVFSISTGF